MKIKFLFFILIVLTLTFCCKNKETLNIEISNNILKVDNQTIDLSKDEKDILANVRISDNKNIYGIISYRLENYPIVLGYDPELKKFKYVIIDFFLNFRNEHFHNKFKWNYYNAKINGFVFDSIIKFDQVKKIVKDKKHIIFKKAPHIIYFSNDDLGFIDFNKNNKRIAIISVYVNGFKSSFPEETEY